LRCDEDMMTFYKNKREKTNAMSNIKFNFSKKILAVILSILMVFGTVPFSVITAFAATAEHPNAVTISVQDEEGNPVSDAQVIINVDSKINGSNYISKTVSTDANGCVEVMDSSSYIPNDLTLTATVNKTHFKTDTSINAADITSDVQNFSVTLKSCLIKDVSIKPTTVKYDGSEYPAAEVTGIKYTDIVKYKLDDGNWQSNMPTIRDVKTYSLTVSVQRDGFDTFEETVNPEVSLNTIELNVTEYSGNYDKGSHPALNISGLRDTDFVTYTINGSAPQNDIPTVTDVGKYEVAVHVERYGYENFDKVYSNIEVKATEIYGLSADSYQGVYDGEEHNAITVVRGTEFGDKIEYKLDDGSWEEECPKIKDAGNYSVQVRVTRTNYLTTEVQVFPANAYIKKADQTLSFTNSKYVNGDIDKVTLDNNNPENNVYDFSANGGDATENDITYKVENSSNDGIDISDIATIDENGQLTVKKAGCITVTATRPGNKNYNDGIITYNLVINSSGNLITFQHTSENYVFGENNGIVSSLRAEKSSDDNGELKYSLDKNDIGLEINPYSGIVTIKDYNALARALFENQNSVSITVTVKKSVGTKRVLFIDYVVYSEDSASYTINISFLATPEDTYVLNGTKGNNDWYITPVTVTAKDSSNYLISKSCDISSFGDSVLFEDQGANSRYIYLKDKISGRITAPILLDGVKIDTVKPDTANMKIEYSTSIADTVLSAVTFGFYKPSVTVKFTAEDVSAGIDHFDWTYKKQENSSEKNKESDGGQLSVTTNGTIATAEIVLTATDTAQLCGNIAFTATDKAGNESNEVKSEKDGKTYAVVVDTISPTCEVSFSDYKNIAGNHMYFDGDVTANIKINEANFFAEDVKVTVSKNGESPYNVIPAWVDNSADEHIGTLVLSGDGDYVIHVNYKDRSKNEMVPYESDTITIDTIKPVIGFSYDKNNQTTTFSVTEHNFRPEDITVTADAKDITGAPVNTNNITNLLKYSEWSKNGDTYSITVSNYVDAIYNLAISYTDISGNKADDKIPESFIIDHTKPTGTVIEYSESIVDTILSKLTLGFYNPSVTVTFTAYDKTAGVDCFIWNYTKQSGASNVNRDSDNCDYQLEAVQDGTDKSKFTASVKLPNDEATQLRGYIAVTSKDKCANVSDKLTDSGKIIIVDTIAPTMKVEYSQANRTAGNKMYYKNDVTAKFIVNEANFFAEDVKVTVSKNGEKAYAVAPTWVNNGTDEHIGTLKLAAPSNHSGDGSYVINVMYKDRSNNSMKSYTSGVIIIDTTAPTVKVSYNNNNVVNTLKDSEGHIRHYYDKIQEAEVTINEHNFDADDVKFSISAKDVTGAALNTSGIISKSHWYSNGDKHTITITYKGDANYSFDVDYTDLAANKMADYKKDYFTVDKTAPENLTVSFSKSLLQTILESVSFGFYNAKVTVKIKADDKTSGIHEFDYSCVRAKGVSAVNAQLLSQKIKESSISYTNSGKTASVSFDIPKGILGSNNQFNGTVSFTAKDRCGKSKGNNNASRIVVDNIAPTATVTYNSPVKTENGVSYYSGNINATVNVTEANFYPEDISVMVSKNGGPASAVKPSVVNNNADLHILTFTLTGDGDYVVSIDYKDKSNNRMVSYKSNKLTIDTTIAKPIITINGADGNGKAYKGEVIPSVSFNDQNYDSYKISLTRTRYNQKNVDVKDKFIKHIGVSEKGGSGSFNTFPKKEENDGIYTLSVKVTDKAGHESTSSVVFTINRFGSVYSYNDVLNDLIVDGGAYVKSVNKDIVITEYNANRLVGNPLVEITRDGKPLSGVKYDISPAVNDKVAVGQSGWYQYEYKISKSNFSQDGVYKISVSSKDTAGNTPQNTNYKNQNILFRVDNTAPELTSVTGLESNIINAQEVTVRYNAYDTIGLKSIAVFVNGKQLGDKITDFAGDRNNYDGHFSISESNNAQKVRIVVEDLAGNVTDTDSSSFKSTYAFEKQITVSTNAFVRFYANRKLFWGTMCGAVLLSAAVCFTVLFKMRKSFKKADAE
jgi:hypothetical protein